jgi:hypothetical protein
MSGWGVSQRTPAMDITMPGEQNPHWDPWHRYSRSWYRRSGLSTSHGHHHAGGAEPTLGPVAQVQPLLVQEIRINIDITMPGEQNPHWDPWHRYSRSWYR